jgi:excisionase family DNA binding protein
MSATMRPATPRPTPAEEETLVRVGYVCQYLSISRSKAYQMMDNGTLEYALIGKSRRVPLRALRELAERSRVRRQPA